MEPLQIGRLSSAHGARQGASRGDLSGTQGQQQETYLAMFALCMAIMAGDKWRLNRPAQVHQRCDLTPSHVDIAWFTFLLTPRSSSTSLLLLPFFSPLSALLLSLSPLCRTALSPLSRTRTFACSVRQNPLDRPTLSGVNGSSLIGKKKM